MCLKIQLYASFHSELNLANKRSFRLFIRGYKAASPGHVKAEPEEQQAEESLLEEKPGDPDPLTSLPDKSDGEHDVSAMEVE